MARHTKDPNKLTPREREVARIATDGLNNAEIGSVLGVSEETVHVHMRHVVAKTGLRRAALWKLFVGERDE